jgi:hypothetical protein
MGKAIFPEVGPGFPLKKIPASTNDAAMAPAAGTTRRLIF